MAFHVDNLIVYGQTSAPFDATCSRGSESATMMASTGRVIAVAALFCVTAIVCVCIAYTVIGIVFLPLVLLLFPIFAIALRPRR